MLSLQGNSPQHFHSLNQVNQNQEINQVKMIAQLLVHQKKMKKITAQKVTVQLSLEKIAAQLNRE
jgi:hypothetical protein